MHNQSAHRTVIILVIFALSLMTFTMIWHKMQNASQADTGTIFPKPRDLQSLRLNSTLNKKFTEKNFQGHWTLMSFGFTHCPDVCPTTMALLNQVYPTLSEKYPTLQVVMVTVDPNRDDVKALKNYLKSFNTNFIGLTGTEKQLAALQKQLGVTALHTTDKQGAPKFEHTASIFVINPEGKWAALLPYGMGVDAFTNAFEKIA